MNTKVIFEYIKIINPTVTTQVGDLKRIPFYESMYDNRIVSIAKKCVDISRSDWDSFETSWDFQRHPMLTFGATRLEDAFHAWQAACEDRFTQLRANEEELNRIFIDIYGLADELTPDVAERDVTVARIFDTADDIPAAMKGNAYVLTRADVARSLISYAVGCMFGRYSLDEDGLVFAGGQWDASRYHAFTPDSDDILPVCDDDYFEDDLVGRYEEWLTAAFGAEHENENLQWTADALGRKGTARETIRSYFLHDFYADHVRRYQSRPIYWCFDAGRKDSFKAFIYIHRYDRDTMARLRTGYVYQQQEVYKAKIEMLEQRLEHATTTAEKNKSKKELKKMQTQFDEIHAYEEKIHHYADRRIVIDLDDGVKKNYAIFADVLGKLKR